MKLFNRYSKFLNLKINVDVNGIICFDQIWIDIKLDLDFFEFFYN